MPRDLKVTTHPRGQAITQVIDINFAGCKALVNYLGRIYTQVDRRYYHSNLGLAAAAYTYDEINSQPGYQRLCGDDAYTTSVTGTTTPILSATRASRTFCARSRTSSAPMG